MRQHRTRVLRHVVQARHDLVEGQAPSRCRQAQVNQEAERRCAVQEGYSRSDGSLRFVRLPPQAVLSCDEEAVVDRRAVQLRILRLSDAAVSRVVVVPPVEQASRNGAGEGGWILETF